MVVGCIGSGLAELLMGHLAGVPILVGAAFSVGLAYAGRIMAVRAKAREASLLYVPPVRQQISTLPAEEVLLRGVEAPAAATHDLLRAAQEGAKMGSGELLRPAEEA